MPSSLASRREAKLHDDERRCILRHLAIASTSLARSGVPSSDASRFAGAEARLRAILQLDGDIRGRCTPACPSVRAAAGAPISLADLLADACRHNRQRLPLWSFDLDLLDAAKELLCGLDWYLPD